MNRWQNIENYNAEGKNIEHKKHRKRRRRKFLCRISKCRRENVDKKMSKVQNVEEKISNGRNVESAKRRRENIERKKCRMKNVESRINWMSLLDIRSSFFIDWSHGHLGESSTSHVYLLFHFDD